MPKPRPMERVGDGLTRGSRLLNGAAYRALQQMGIAPAVPPEGAFYMLANVKKYAQDSLSLAFRILEEAKVAVTPGIDFGPGAEGYIRISYACTMAELQEGLLRLQKFFQAYS